MNYFSTILRKMRLVSRLSVSVGLLAATAPGVIAAETATAVITPTSLGGGDFDYSIKLTDTGTTTIGTFWYAWVPGQDYLPLSPLTTAAPAGWSANITNAGGSDGYAIQWVAASSANFLTPGGSFTFDFTTTATPTQVSGNSVFYPGTPTGTSFIYSAGPFSDGGTQFVATVAAPEPSTLGMFFFAAALMGGLTLRWRSGTVVP